MVAIERFVLYWLTALAFLSSVGIAISVLIVGNNSVIASFLVLQYLLFSPVTFYAYWRDKSTAKHQNWRTPEVWLHTLEIGGGWLAAFVAQRILRHKISKKTYQQTYFLIAIYHLFLWGSLILFPGSFGWFNFLLYTIALSNLKH